MRIGENTYLITHKRRTKNVEHDNYYYEFEHERVDRIYYHCADHAVKKCKARLIVYKENAEKPMTRIQKQNHTHPSNIRGKLLHFYHIFRCI